MWSRPVILWLSLLALPGMAADRYVETSGDDAGNTCLSSGSPCRTIEHALSESSSGDAVYVGAGTFSNTASTYPLRVPSGVDLIGTAGNATSIGSGSFSTLELLDGTASNSLQDMDVFGFSGHGVVIQGTGNGGNITLSNVSISASNNALQVQGSSGSGFLSVNLDTVDLDGSVALYVDSFGSDVSVSAADLDLDAYTEAISAGSYGGVVTVDLDTITSTGGGRAGQVYGSGNVRLAMNYGTIDNGSGMQLSGSSGTLNLYMNSVSMSGSTGSTAIEVYMSGGDAGVVLRDSEFAVGTGMFMSLNQASTNLLLDNVEMLSANNGLQISASSSGDLDIDIRDTNLDAAFGFGTGLNLHTAFGVNTDFRMIGGTVSNGSTGINISHDASANAQYLIDGITVTNNSGTGLAIQNTSSGITADVDIHRSLFDSNGLGVYFSRLSGSVMDVQFNKNQVTNNLGDGMFLENWGDVDPGTRMQLVGNTIMDNATSYTQSGAYDIRTAGSFSASNLGVDANDNWWGTQDPAVVESHLRHFPSGTTGPTINYSLLTDTMTFEVQPPYGTEFSGLVRIESTSIPFVDQAGPHEMTVSIGGVNQEIVWGESSGDALYIQRGPMAPGTYDVSITDAQGRTSTQVGGYTVQSVPGGLNVQHQDFTIGKGTWVRVVGPPNTAARIYISRFATGPQECPPQLQGGCLQIPGPLAVRRPIFIGPSGVVWERIEPAPARTATYATMQVVAEGVRGFQYSSPVTSRFLEPTSDADLDGVDNSTEHNQGSDAYGRNTDNDTCYDGVDSDPHRSSNLAPSGFAKDCDPYVF